MLQKLIQAFPSIKAKELSDKYIESHPDLMCDVPAIPSIRAVPLYMYWCVEHKQEEGSLIFVNTISALNNYSRIKDSKLGYQDFKFSCDSKKIETIVLFLESESVNHYGSISCVTFFKNAHFIFTNFK